MRPRAATFCSMRTAMSPITEASLRRGFNFQARTHSSSFLHPTSFAECADGEDDRLEQRSTGASTECVIHVAIDLRDTSDERYCTL